MISLNEEEQFLISSQRDVTLLLEPYYGRVIKVERLHRESSRLISNLYIGRIEFLSHLGKEAQVGVKSYSLSTIRLTGYNEDLWIWPPQSRISLLQEDLGQWKVIYQGEKWEDTHPELAKKESA